jgi:hypothetical protein
MNIANILSKNYPNTKWVLNGDDYSGLEWLSDSDKPTEKQLKNQWAEVKYEIELDEVKAARHAAYIAPSGSDAVFMKYQRGEATEQEWLDAVQAINDAHPYPVKEGK